MVNSEWSMVNGERSIVNSERPLVPADVEAFLDSLKAPEVSPFTIHHSPAQAPLITVATSSIRRKAQWLNRYPNHTIDNLRGNVNTRMRKVGESNWHGAIFAAAGLERINLRPENSIELDWMLPAPAQGAVMVVCREGAREVIDVCAAFNDETTATCAKVERDFLRELLGGCSTPISALAQIKNDNIFFKGNILSVDGKQKVSIEKTTGRNEAQDWGRLLAIELLNNGGQVIADGIRSK